jgi:hypothetical protein
MVRKITTSQQQKRNAQWNAAWLMLTSAQRAAIFIFLINADNDVGRAAIGATD